MILRDAEEILARTLAPCTYDRFFDEIVSKRPLALLGGDAARRCIAGEDPRQAILSGFARYAPTLTCHIRTPEAPPPMPRAVGGPDEFRQLIGEYHDRGYTVRIPDVTNLSAPLDRLTRALEMLMGTEAGVVVFWSSDELLAPVHHDEVDVIVIQLYGTKRWFVSDAAPTLPNKWKALGEGKPDLGAHTVHDLQPGDFLYVPRGTPHTVQSTSESVHIAIGFIPVTVRDAVAASLDFLSDLDPTIRRNLGVRADGLSHNSDMSQVLLQVRAAVDKLHKYCQSDAFVRDALMHRQARQMLELPPLRRSEMRPVVTADSRLRRTELAMVQLAVTPDIVDFRQPGQQTLIHLGVADAMRFIAATPEFTVRDIPTDGGDAVRVALVERLLGTGFLEPVPAWPSDVRAAG
ncbi:MAG: hypothetical protein EP335_03215 [Alphaproteobacteria bacterium]|nr:MAG: hypothetical protein EP335_03215 [Alphaproteobacteria bacterium]